MPGTSIPAPTILTAPEAVRLLRLDEPDRALNDAIRSLERIIKAGGIVPIRIGKFNRYLLVDVIGYALSCRARLAAQEAE